MRQLQLEKADLENHSRCNNIKIGSILESVKPIQLGPYLKKLFHKLILDLTAQNLLIDGVHRIQKPTYLPAMVPRDTLAQLHYFHIKERIIRAVRTAHSFPDPYTQIFL